MDFIIWAIGGFLAGILALAMAGRRATNKPDGKTAKIVAAIMGYGAKLQDRLDA